MKRLFAGAVLAAVAVIPSLSGAAGVVDGRECERTFIGGRPVAFTPGGGINGDRFAVCVSDGTSGNGAEVYIGGELHPELTTSGGAFCGAVIVAGRTVHGTPDWDRTDVGADPTDTVDDVHLSCD